MKIFYWFLGGSAGTDHEQRGRKKKKSSHGSISSANEDSEGDLSHDLHAEKRLQEKKRERLHMERQQLVDAERARLKELKRRNSEKEREVRNFSTMVSES